MRRVEERQAAPATVQPLVAEEEAAAGTAVGLGAERVLTTKQLAWRRFKRHKLAIGSGVVLLLLGLSAVLAPWIVRVGPNTQDFAAVLSGPSGKHWLGTDNLGSDVFSRLLYGGRISLLVGVSVAISATIIGAFIGSMAGFYGKWLDNLLMRTTDLFLAIPFLVTLIVASRIPFIANLGVLGIIILLSLFFWMSDARIVRGLFLSLKEKEFVEAAKSSGASNSRIIFGHIFPNTLGPVIVTTTLNVAYAILAETALSFLGFGIQPPTPSWGNLLKDAQNFALVSPGLVWFPGLAILITVLCVNFLGDGLRDALDPHQELKTGL